MTGFSRAVRGIVYERAGWRCERCGGLPIDALHHRRPRGMGGTSLGWVNQPANGVALCRPCHDWTEAEPVEARRLGWLLSLGDDDAESTPLTAPDGRTWWLLDDGGRIDFSPAGGLPW